MNLPPIYNRFFSVLVFAAAVFLVSRPSAVSASGAGETDRRGYAEEEPSEQLTPYCMQSGYTPFPDSIIYTQPENPGRGIAVPSVNKHGEVIPVAFVIRRDDPGFDELRKGVDAGGELLTPLGGLGGVDRGRT